MLDGNWREFRGTLKDKLGYLGYVFGGYFGGVLGTLRDKTKIGGINQFSFFLY